MHCFLNGDFNEVKFTFIFQGWFMVWFCCFFPTAAKEICLSLDFSIVHLIFKVQIFFLQNKTINWQISLWHIFVMYFSTCFFTWKERFDTSTVHRIEVMSVSKLSPILEKLTLHYPSIVSYTALASSIVFLGICDFETNFNE